MIVGLKRGNAEIVKATRELLDDLSERIKEKDIIEVTSLFITEPKEYLRKQNPDNCYIVLVDGKPSVVFGVNLSCSYTRKGIIWMVSDENIDEMPMRFAKHTRTVISHFLEQYTSMFNYVYVNNEKSIKWLRFAGAKFDETVNIGIFNMPFRKFTFERKC